MLTVLMSFTAAVVSGSVFVVALFHQFALVEVAASIFTGLQVFFLSSAIGDLLDEKERIEPGKEFGDRADDGVSGGVLFLHAVFPLEMKCEVTMTGAQVTFDQ